MLRSLHIENYVLIESLDIEFPESLVIITGETGAGKSILLGAVSLLAGGRADASLISAGKETCVVEAEFEVEPDSPLKEILEDNDAEWDGGRILIRRVLHRSGRARSFVNDSPVPVSALSDIASRLIDIHSQHQSLLLSDKRFQLSVLDSYAGAGEEAKECRTVWNSLQAARSELSELKDRLKRMEADKDYNEAQLGRLVNANIVEGELEELEAEERQLSNAEEIKQSLSRVESLFSPSDAPGIDASLKDASKSLERLAKYFPQLAEISSRIESSRIELSDILSEIEELDSSVNLSESRLQEVDERLSLIYSLLKKHSCANLEELFAVRDSFSRAISDSSSLEDDIAELEKRISSLEGEFGKLCGMLHEKRSGAAPRFAAEILDSLRFLELERSVFEVRVSPSAPGPSGSDDVSFLFSSSGSNAADIAKCASGGELSRIMLSLKAMMARFREMPTLVFDEIDTGVSGSVADRMGSMICSLGDSAQVFAITHLPQVAAKGSAHYIVRKKYSDEGGASSSITRIDGADRIKEIARLLSGSTITPEAEANARSLLNLQD